MEEEETLSVVSGDIENIIIKLEPIQDLEVDDSLEYEGIHSEIEDEFEVSEDKVFFGDLCHNEFISSSEESVPNIVQTPFYLESYFRDVCSSRNLNELEVNRLACHECQIIFPAELVLQEHLVTHIDIHRMGCNVCDQDLNTAEKFQLHVMAITRQSIYYCDLCKKSCAGVVRSKNQLRSAGKIYACHDCEIQTTGRPWISNGAPSIKPQECKIENCTLHLNPSAKLDVQQIHKEKHNGVTCMACEYCSKVCAPDVRQQVTRLNDENCQTDNKVNGTKLKSKKCMHTCEHCEAFFAESLTLTRHLRERHKVSKLRNQRNSKLDMNDDTTTENLKCECCDTVFAEHTALTRHLQEKHKQDEPVSCDEEKKTIKFKCSYCDVSYSENLTLTKHLREKHKTDKHKYICKLCRKEFTLQRCYDNHMNFHQLAKNYVCFECNLAFLSKFELAQHVRVHNRDNKDASYDKCRSKKLTNSEPKRSTRRIRVRKTR